ncbi:MAG: ATPase, T2SS/T4P/T4SS family [Bacillota bacterium]|nr:ATPase, T2SS/T4P/T4SS family [Bacillota bacterium]
MSKKKRLGDMLVETGLISNEQLMEALNKQKASNKKLGRVLMDMGFVQERDLFEVLQMQYSIPYFDLNSSTIDPKVPKLISKKLAEHHMIIPVRFENNIIYLAMSDPLDVIAIDDVKVATGLSVKTFISSDIDIERALHKYYDSTDEAKEAARRFAEQNETQDIVVGETADVANSPIVRLVNTVILESVRSKASDIHIEPFEHYVRIRIRVDGVLNELMSPEKAAHSGIVTRIKIMAALNISERRVPQDGRIEQVIDGQPVDMRVSILPTVYGEKIVIRILDRSGALLSREQLGFSPYNNERLNKILKAPEGIFLMTGPTGSGKTTTLYTILKEFNSIETNIITVEDPVEYRIDGINQVQTNDKAGLTFASGLRSILRQDPDIVMVGEIRDSETAQIAVRAAITGHFVLSTLHTNDTASTLARLVDMGVEHFMVSTAVKGVLAQRLVRRICRKCAYIYTATIEEKKMLGLKPDRLVKLKRGRGCNGCNGTGYAGRCGIHEVLIVDDKIKDLMSKNAGIGELQRAAVEGGMKTLNESCAELVKQGLTTVEELVRVAYQAED